ncbi:hypothetical protein JCM10450v2_000051 [Rhodotorula kratochvilovae]
MADAEPGPAPAAPPAKRSRSRTGCLTCRKYHKRCCETRPLCTRCARLGHDCTWPAAVQKSRSNRSGSTSATIPTVPLPPVVPVASTSTSTSAPEPSAMWATGPPAMPDPLLWSAATGSGGSATSASGLSLSSSPPGLPALFGGTGMGDSNQVFDFEMLAQPLANDAQPALDQHGDTEWQQALSQLVHDLFGGAGEGGADPSAAAASGAGAFAGDGFSAALTDPVPDPGPVQNALVEFYQHCADLTAAAAPRAVAAAPGSDPLPEIYNCKKGSHVLELLPTAFIWLNAYKIGNELPLLAGYARYMDTFLATSHEVVCSAALTSGGAFLAVQRFDDECSIELKKAIGEAFLNATGISFVDMSDAAAAINRQLGSIREKVAPALEAFLEDPNQSVPAKVSCLYDIAMTEDLLDGAAQCAQTLDRITSIVKTAFPTFSTLHLTDLAGFQHQAFGKWIGADVLSSILRNRRTCFVYTCDETPSELQRDPSEVTGIEWLFACPDVIMCSMASISNLACDIRADPSAYDSTGQLALQYAMRRDLLFDTITSYTPRLKPHLRGSAFHNVTRIAAQEVWRAAALIHFHQVLYALPAEHDTLQRILASFFEVYAVVEQGLPALLMGPMAVPMFLASTIATTPDAQYRLRRRHEMLHPYTGPRDCHRFVEKLWRLSFAQGKQVDWHKLAEQEKPLAYL